MKKFIATVSLCAFQALNALTFGNMGNTSAGLGDSGVALRKSAWGVYYNPALLASDNRGKFGYSVGVGLEQRGLGDVLSAIMDNGGNVDVVGLYNQLHDHPTNSLALSSQNGIVIQITGGVREVPKLDEEGKPTDEMVEVRSPIGAFTMAAFLSAFGAGNIGSSLSSDTLSVNGNIDGLILLEVPVGWGWRFETSGGDISIGAAIKYMGASSLDVALTGSVNAAGESSLNFKNNFSLSPANSFGIDLGLLYSIYGFNVGFVAKNINVPTFELNNGKKFKISPQFRMGLSYEFAEYFTLTLDSDLAPNDYLFDGSYKTQMIGGGLLMDFKYIDLRFGLMGDMANKFDNGVIITGGINLLGFLDVALQASSEMFSLKGYKIPNALNVKVGGSFTF